MHWIDYVSPHSVREATELLAEHGESARILAGGTDLLVLLRGGAMDNVNLVVDGKSVPELNEVTYDPQTGLTLGAAVPCYKIYNNQAVAHAYPGLIDTASLIGGTQIQGRATLGGNLCNAAPSGDSIPAMIALGGVANIAGPSGNRSVPVEQRGAFLHTLGRSEDRLENLVLDVDQRGGLLGDVWARRGDGRNGVTLVKRLVAGEDVIP